MFKTVLVTFLLASGMYFHMSPVHAQNSRNITSKLLIKPGKMSVGRLKNVPNNVEVRIAISSQEPIWIYIVDEAGYKSFPKIKNPLVMAHVFSVLTLTTRLEKGGNYFILFQNRNLTKTVTANFFAKVKLIEQE